MPNRVCLLAATSTHPPHFHHSMHFDFAKLHGAGQYFRKKQSLRIGQKTVLLSRINGSILLGFLALESRVPAKMVGAIAKELTLESM